MTPEARAVLEGIAEDLVRLESRANQLGEVFLAFLIGTAAGEAGDQLRDDSLSKREAKPSSGIAGLAL